MSPRERDAFEINFERELGKGKGRGIDFDF